MHATMRRYEGVPDPDRVTQEVNESFVPMLQEMRGFVSYTFIDAGDGVMVSTSVFEDENCANESNEKAAAFVQEKLADMLPNDPQISAGKVVARS